MLKIKSYVRYNGTNRAYSKSNISLTTACEIQKLYNSGEKRTKSKQEGGGGKAKETKRRRGEDKIGRYLDNETRNFQNCLNGTLKTRGQVYASYYIYAIHHVNCPGRARHVPP